MSYEQSYERFVAKEAKKHSELAAKCQAIEKEILSAQLAQNDEEVDKQKILLVKAQRELEEQEENFVTFERRWYGIVFLTGVIAVFLLICTIFLMLKKALVISGVLVIACNLGYLLTSFAEVTSIHIFCAIFMIFSIFVLCFRWGDIVKDWHSL